MVKKCRILLVDDEEGIVYVLKRGLEQAGFEVDAYSDPAEALTNFRAGKYDLLLLDMRMPGMTGVQLFRKIRTIDETVKVLFLTAFEILDKEWQMVLPHTEANGFIKKPIRLEDLVDAIKRITAKPAK